MPRTMKFRRGSAMKSVRLAIIGAALAPIGMPVICLKVAPLLLQRGCPCDY